MHWEGFGSLHGDLMYSSGRGRSENTDRTKLRLSRVGMKMGDFKRFEITIQWLEELGLNASNNIRGILIFNYGEERSQE